MDYYSTRVDEAQSQRYDCEAGYLHVFLGGIKLARLSDAARSATMSSLRGRLADACSRRHKSLKKAGAVLSLSLARL